MLDREALVARFLQSYAKDHNRTGVITQPALYGDLMASVRREALLAMVTYVDEALPRRLGLGNHPSAAAQKKKKLKASGKCGSRNSRKKVSATRPSAMTGRELAAHAAVLDLFREEFIVALGRALRWGEAESGEFARDYDLYEATRSRAGSERSGGSTKNISSGPFVDRCGLLLDPSMLEQARRAAGRFQVQLQGAAEGVLKKVFSARRDN